MRGATVVNPAGAHSVSLHAGDEMVTSARNFVDIDLDGSYKPALAAETVANDEKSDAPYK